jgi:hypothetical protein
MTQQPRRSPLEPPKNARRPQKRKALGPVTIWSDARIDEMAQISDADIQAAVDLWQGEAPKPLRNILQAKVEEKKQ